MSDTKKEIKNLETSALLASIDTVMKLQDAIDILDECRKENIEGRKAILENNKKLERLYHKMEFLKQATHAEYNIRTYKAKEREIEQLEKEWEEKKRQLK